jgi:hypothetical protein
MPTEKALMLSDNCTSWWNQRKSQRPRCAPWRVKTTYLVATPVEEVQELEEKPSSSGLKTRVRLKEATSVADEFEKHYLHAYHMAGEDDVVIRCDGSHGGRKAGPNEHTREASARGGGGRRPGWFREVPGHLGVCKPVQDAFVDSDGYSLERAVTSCGHRTVNAREDSRGMAQDWVLHASAHHGVVEAAESTNRPGTLEGPSAVTLSPSVGGAARRLSTMGEHENTTMCEERAPSWVNQAVPLRGHMDVWLKSWRATLGWSCVSTRAGLMTGATQGELRVACN